jgi:D-sedoheptulose 7-phosphate isomerase
MDSPLPIRRLRENLASSVQSKQRLLADQKTLDLFAEAVEIVVRCYQRGCRLYAAGNGGSAADAQHLVAEFVSKLARPRAPLPAEALTVDTSVLTAIGNDYGYEHIFSRQLEAKLQEGDVFLAITTSGQSPNILEALRLCRTRKTPSIALCGRDGGAAKTLADYCIIAPGEQTSTIQEMHICLYHTLCECVEETLFAGTWKDSTIS